MPTILQDLGIGLILILQHLSPTLDGVMKFFTFVGRIDFYLILIPFIYWSVDNRLGFRLLLVLITADIIGSTCKLLFHEPRPYWLGSVKALSTETSYGMPSTHASDSLAVWGYLAYCLNKKWLWILLVAVVLLIGISRLYLGVHFPHDVLFGWLVGAVVVWAFVKSESKVAIWASQQQMETQIGIGFAISVLMVLLGQFVQIWLSGITDPAEWSSFAIHARTPAYSFTVGGALFGGIAGYAFMKRYAPFQSSGSALRRIGRYALGMIGTLLVYVGLDMIFGLIALDESALGYALRYARYAAATFMLTFLAPWFFLKIGLADHQVGGFAEETAKAIASEHGI